MRKTAEFGFDLMDAQLFVQRREHEALDRLREEAPVCFNPEPAGPGFFAVTRHADVMRVLRDPALFASGRGTQIVDKRAEGHGAASVHNSDPPQHTALRSAAMGAMRKKVADDMEPMIRSIVRDLFDGTPNAAPFDFVRAVATPLPMLVIARLLGVPPDQQRRTVDWANTMSDTAASAGQQAQARQELFGCFRTLAAERRRQPAQDLATVLVQAQIDGEHLTPEQLDAYFLLLTVAGNETTRFLISLGLEQLCRQPDEFARLRAHPEHLGLAVEEMVRFVSPVMQMRRTVTAPCELAGQDLHQGDKVVTYFNAANRDGSLFHRPHELQIDRQPNPHIGFGFGVHICMGAHFARAEARIFLEEFLARYRECRLVAPGTRAASYWFNGLIDLPLSWTAA